MRTDKSALAPSVKMTNWLVLGSVAFGVSFVLNLMVNRDFGKAFFAGVITIPAAFVSEAVIRKRRLNRERRFRNSLSSQIQELEAYKDDMNQYIIDALSEEQGLEASLNNLRSELSYVRSQVSEGYNQRKAISWELVSFQEQKQQKLVELSVIQEQVNAIENQISQLNQVLATKSAEVRKAETELNLIKSETRQLLEQIVELEQDKQALEQVILNSKIQKTLLLEEENQVRQSLAFFSSELLQLKAQVKPQNEQLSINQEVLILREEKSKLEAELALLRRRKKSAKPLTTQLLDLPTEWIEFVNQLPNYGVKVIQAIAEPSQSMATLKTIAEANLTMPELLIDSINNCAMNTIGDRIIEPGSTSNPPVIAPEYTTLVNQVIISDKS